MKRYLWPSFVHTFAWCNVWNDHINTAYTAFGDSCMPNSFAYPTTRTATDVLLSIDPSKDEVVSAIGKRIAAWTFLPEGNMHWVIWLMELDGHSLTAAMFLVQKTLNQFRFCAMKSVKSMMPTLIIFMTKKTWSVAVSELQLSLCTWQMSRRVERLYFQMLRYTLTSEIIFLSFENRALRLLQFRVTHSIRNVWIHLARCFQGSPLQYKDETWSECSRSGLAGIFQPLTY